MSRPGCCTRTGTPKTITAPTPKDIRTLKVLIRVLRMLDMPVDYIVCAAGNGAFVEAAQRQTRRLQQQARELESAIRFCADLEHNCPEAAALDVDACLTRIHGSRRKLVHRLGAGLPGHGPGGSNGAASPLRRTPR